MSGTNRGHSARQALQECALVCIGICVVFSLAPCADFDLDGSLDSFATEGFIMIAAVPGFELPALLLRQPASDEVRRAESRSAPIPHPPTH